MYRMVIGEFKFWAAWVDLGTPSLKLADISDDNVSEPEVEPLIQGGDHSNGKTKGIMKMLNLRSRW